MAALSKAYEAFIKPNIIATYKVAASTTIYKGALVGVNSSGFAIPMAHGTASLKFVGIAEETVANGGSNGAASIRVSKAGSGVYADAGTAVQADVGKEVYANTDNDVQVVTTGLTNQYKVGTLVALETTSGGAVGLRVRIDNYTV
jgi:hypothetical protein